MSRPTVCDAKLQVVVISVVPLLKKLLIKMGPLFFASTFSRVSASLTHQVKQKASKHSKQFLSSNYSAGLERGTKAVSRGKRNVLLPSKVDNQASTIRLAVLVTQSII